jgi:urease accessory protein
MVSPVRHGNDIVMKHARSIVPVGNWSDATAVDHVVLDATERHRRRMMLTGERGTEFLLDLPHATLLRDGDGLLLEDGAIVRVDGKPEHLIEIATTSAPELARIAWHIGNRHTDVQVVGDRLRIRYDHVLEDMLRGLGATLTRLHAPFDPERGAYHGEHGEHGGHGQHT